MEPGRESALHEILTALQIPGGAVTSSLAGEQRNETTADSPGPECALCLLIRRSIIRSLRAFFAEFVNDPEVRVRFRKARGFCGEHTPLLLESGDALGAAILYADLADETRQRWQSGARERKDHPFKRWMVGTAKAGCPACLVETEAENRYVAALASALEQESVWNALQAGSELCVRHIENVASAAGAAGGARLLKVEAARLERLQQELEEFIRKNDYRFRQEPWGEERNAWRRALYRLRRP